MSEVIGFWIPFYVWLMYLEQALYIVRRQKKTNRVIVSHIEL